MKKSMKAPVKPACETAHENPEVRAALAVIREIRRLYKVAGKDALFPVDDLEKPQKIKAAILTKNRVTLEQQRVLDSMLLALRGWYGFTGGPSKGNQWPEPREYFLTGGEKGRFPGYWNAKAGALVPGVQEALDMILEIKRVIDEELSDDIRSVASDFFDGALEALLEMGMAIEGKHEVTWSQRRILENMLRGLHRWVHRASKEAPHGKRT